MVGTVTGPLGLPLSYDGLPTTDFKLVFPLLPTVTMFLQSLDIPSIKVNEVTRSTRYIDCNEIGEKINYEPFTVTFLSDKNLVAYYEIFSWMRRMTVAGTKIGQTDNPYVLIGDKTRITFIDAWPMELSNLQFKANEDDMIYITGTAIFNYDYLQLDSSIIPNN